MIVFHNIKTYKLPWYIRALLWFKRPVIGVDGDRCVCVKSLFGIVYVVAEEE